MKVLAFGTYERDYPRNRMAIDGLRRSGVEVEECHEPVWELVTHKAGSALSPLGLLRWARLYLRAALRLIRRARSTKFDCLLVGYPAHVDMLLARLVAGKRPILFNPLLSLYDTLVVDRGRFAAGSALARAVALLDRIAFGIADRVAIDTDAQARWLAVNLGIESAKLDAIAVGAEEIFHPPADPPSPTETFDVLFYGKLIPLHGIETILDAAEIIERDGSEGIPIRLQLVGCGQLDEWLEAELARRKLAMVERREWIEYERLPEALGEAHVALGIFGTSDKASRVLPNKAFQALACATPLITADTVAAREFLTDEHDALLVEAGNGEALAEAVLKLRNDESLRREIGRAGRALFERIGTVDRIGKEFAMTCERATSV